MGAAFRAVAALALAALGALTSSRVFFFIAAFMLAGLPFAFRIAKAAAELRREGMGPVPPEVQSVPQEAAERIIDKLKALSKSPVSNKVLAVQTLQVFETLNSRPPGWLASVALLGVHGVSLILAVAFVFAFVLARDGSGFIREAASAPRHVVSAETIERTSDLTAGASLSPGAVIATYKNKAAAAAAYGFASGQAAGERAAQSDGGHCHGLVRGLRRCPAEAVAKRSSGRILRHLRREPGDAGRVSIQRCGGERWRGSGDRR
jgi:hypothetical protein